MNNLGLLFAISALLFWTLGDLFIERSTRKVGDWKTIFFIGLGGCVGITPFIYKDLPALFHEPRSVLLLLVLSVITLFSALFLFESLKRGKLSVVEPVFGIELPFTIAFSIILGGENLPLMIYILCGVIFAGILLAVITENHHLHRMVLEKGVVLAVIGAVGMGLINYLAGVGSREISPLLTIWFMHTFQAVACLIYLIYNREARHLLKDLKRNAQPVIFCSLFDNAAWTSFAFSMSLIPISIATTVSESYIILAVLLGMFINKEKLAKHQIIGGAIGIGGVLLLSYLVSS